jgi:hypothetical protein
MRETKPVVRVVVPLLVAILFGVSLPVFADDHGGGSRLKAGIVRGADLQLSRQGSYANGDTGIGVYVCAWEWEIGSGLAYRNTQGASARGLVAAYKVTRNRAYLTGAVCAADQVISRYEADPADRRLFGDILLLTDLAEVTFHHGYASRARSYFASIKAQFPTGAALADHDLARRSLAGWDGAMQIEAALAVDEADYARELALQLIARRAEWESIPSGGYDYTLLSQGALLEALSELPGRTIRHFRAELRGRIVEAQATDGSWADGDSQTTAFVLRGLLASSDSREVKRAAAGALKYLLSTETAEGGWSSGASGEYGEINGEVLSALVEARRHHRDGDDGDHDCGRDFDEPRPGHRGHRAARAHDEHGDR